jgi:hypothetical protein
MNNTSLILLFEAAARSCSSRGRADRELVLRALQGSGAQALQRDVYKDGPTQRQRHAQDALGPVQEEGPKREEGLTSVLSTRRASSGRSRAESLVDALEDETRLLNTPDLTTKKGFFIETDVA